MDYDMLARELIGSAVKFCQSPERREFGGLIAGEGVALSFLNCRTETRPSELCRALGVTTARTANILKSLEGKGLVERIPDRGDGRRTIVRITEAGKSRAERDLEEVLGAVRMQLELLGLEDAQTFVRLFGRIIENIGKTSPVFHQGAKLC